MVSIVSTSNSTAVYVHGKLFHTCYGNTIDCKTTVKSMQHGQTLEVEELKLKAFDGADWLADFEGRWPDSLQKIPGHLIVQRRPV